MIERCTGSTRSEQAPHLEVTYGERGILEQARQFALDHLRWTHFGAFINDENFLTRAQERQFHSV